MYDIQGLAELVLYEISLIKDAHHADIEEEKISSSSLRTRLLGTLLVPPTVMHMSVYILQLVKHFKVLCSPTSSMELTNDISYSLSLLSPGSHT